MEDNNKHMESNDAFSNLLKQKLEHHQMPVDENVWIQLEKQLQPKRKKIVLWWMIIGSAAVIALLFSIQLFNNIYQQEEYAINNEGLRYETSKPSSITKNTTEKPVKLTNDKTPENNIQAVKTKTNNLDTKRKDKLSYLSENKTIDTNENMSVQEYAESILELENTTAKIESDDTNHSAEQKVDEPTKSSTNKKVEKIYELPNAETVKPEEKQQKHNNSLLLAAAFGSGGSASLSGSNDMLFAEIGDRFMVNAETRYTQILTPNDFANKSFMEPVSFGLTIRKELNKNISFETGLMYTYLLSTFEENGFSHYDATLSLHYLGIPLNLIVPVWKNPKWEVYLSGGGMVEKGLRSVYIQNEYIGNQTITTDARTKIDGLQWSVNAALGGAYKIYRNIDLYFEPKFSYFFDNDQPLSARTDRPVVIGLTAGVRFRL